MDGKAEKACVFGSFVVATYCIYMALGPGGDGYILGSVLLALGAMGGYAWRGTSPSQ